MNVVGVNPSKILGEKKVSETKFTNGPWSVDVSISGDASIRNDHGFQCSSNVIKVDETRLEGESWIAMRDRTETARESAKLEANANIFVMAAAPEMYEMLEAIAKSGDIKMPAWKVTAINMMLTKARGES